MFCHYCGKQLPDEAVFCNYCGKKVPTVGSPPAQQPSQGRITIQFNTGAQFEAGSKPISGPQMAPVSQPTLQAGPPSQPGSYPQWMGPMSSPSQPQLPWQGQSSGGSQPQWTGPVGPPSRPQWTGPVSSPSQPQLPPWQGQSAPASQPQSTGQVNSPSQRQSPSESPTDWTIPVGPPPQPWQPPSTVSPTQWSMPVGSLPQSWPGASTSQTQWTGPVPPAPAWYPPTGPQIPWGVSQAVPESRMQRFLVRVFQPNLARNAFFGIVLGGVLAAVLGALVAGLLLAIAHAFVTVPPDVIYQTHTTPETLVDALVGIVPLQSGARDSMQFFLVMHGIATNAQVSVTDSFSMSNVTANISKPLNGLLLVPALLLIFGGYVAASTDFQNRPRTSLLRGAAIAIPYTLVLLIMALIVNGNVPLYQLVLGPINTSASITATLNVDIPSLLAYGVLWGALFGLVGASIKLGRGQWRHMIRQYLQTNPFSRVSGIITGALVAGGLGFALSLLAVFCLVIFAGFTVPVTGSALGTSNTWQPVALTSILYGPFVAMNLFFLSFGAPGTFNTVCNGGIGGSLSLCGYNPYGVGGIHYTYGMFHSSSPLPPAFYPWIYAFLLIPVISLFLGGRVSVASTRIQGVGAGAIQGALIGLPFTLLMMLLTVISSFAFSLSVTSSSNSGGGNFGSLSLTIGSGAFDLFVWALLFGTVMGAIGGAYQASIVKTRVKNVQSNLAIPFRLLSKPVFLLLDRLTRQPRSAQRSPARSLLYGAFFCTLLLAIAAGIVGVILIALNQTITLGANQLVTRILIVLLVALPGLFLLSACVSALSRDPLENRNNAFPVRF